MSAGSEVLEAWLRRVCSPRREKTARDVWPVEEPQESVLSLTRPRIRLMAPAKLGRVIALLAISSVVLAGCSQIKRHIYEPADRDSWQYPERVVESLSIVPGQRVADLGAGGGYFTFRLARAVGPTGVVYAIDVDTDMTGFLEGRAAESDHENVVVLLVDAAEPELPKVGLDLIFICNTYHHLAERPAYFKRLKRYLSPGGRVAIIDHKPEGWFQRIFPHSSRSEAIRSEMVAGGYRLQSDYDYLPKQSFLVFEPVGD